MNQQQNKEMVTEINWDAVKNYLIDQGYAKGDGPFEVKAFSAGYSNLTYFIRLGDWNGVLRRPPFGPIPPKAHDMEREYEILRKLSSVFPLAPKPYFYCEDPEIMERHFYVMEKKEGVVLDDSMPDQFKNIPEAGRLISEAVVKTLIKLHEIDYKKAGLETLGRPEGFLTRQVHGWIKRYNQSKTDDIPGVEELEKWLVDNIPESPEPTIVHNDYKLNNMMFASDDPGKIVGLFDWELSTIGDPLTDVAAMIIYWEEEGDPFTGLTSVTREPGFASRKEMLEMYVKESGRNLDHFDFYLTFGFYKVAGILQQIYYRWKMGSAKDERFSTLDKGIRNLMEQALRARRGELIR